MMNPEIILLYLQIGMFIIGVITILIAGLQDKKNRIAPAIYLTPTLIGFAINPFLGLAGLVLTITSLFLWKDQWNKKLGLADALLFLTILFTLFNPLTLVFAMLITTTFLIDLLFIQKTMNNAPIIWIFAKWLTIIGILTLIITLIV